jgi:hypothetical protein
MWNCQGNYSHTARDKYRAAMNMNCLALRTKATKQFHARPEVIDRNVAHHRYDDVILWIIYSTAAGKTNIFSAMWRCRHYLLTYTDNKHSTKWKKLFFRSSSVCTMVVNSNDNYIAAVAYHKIAIFIRRLHQRKWHNRPNAGKTSSCHVITLIFPNRYLYWLTASVRESISLHRINQSQTLQVSI